MHWLLSQSRSGLRIIGVLILIQSTFSLTGCFLFPSPPPAPSANITWAQRQAELATLTAWQVKGVIGLQDAKQAQSASLQWTQASADTFAIRLFGPLGVGNTRILGQPGRVTLTTSDNKTFTAVDSESLLRQQTGWQIPIDNLYYWARGLPAPGSLPRLQLDGTAHLQSLQQAGWRIDYSRYTFVNGLDIPSKIILTNGTLTVRLLINQWSFSKKGS